MWRVLSLIAACAVAGVAEECERRWYDYSSYVCVCNATYCDTTEPVGSLYSGSYVVYTSSMNGARLQRSTGSLYFDESSPPPEVASLQVNSSDLRHEILGFGGAMTDATAINIASLSVDAQRRLISSYFSPEGSQYSIVRVPIAGSDFSTHYYTYDDVTNDTQLEHFNLTAEDLELKIPYLKWALNMSSRQVRLLGSAWTAPDWMKESKKRLRLENYQLWTDYYVKFVESYNSQGLQLWGLTGQNEPVLGGDASVTFNSMAWTAEEQAAWLSQHLAPSLKRAGYGDINIFTLDDQRPFMEEWAHVMFENDTISQYLTGMAVHWYLDRQSDPEIITRVHDRFPDKMLLYTEASDGTFMTPGPPVQMGSWERGENYTTDIIQVVSRGVAGWVDWNMALDVSGGPNWALNYVDSPIIVNSTADEFYKQPTYYALAHFSRYVPPGSRSLAVEAQGREGIEYAAFNTPQSTSVIVLQNRNDEDIESVITDVKAGSIKMTIPARSMHTIIYKG